MNLLGTASVRRQYVIAALLLAAGLIGYFVLQRVFWTVLFAVTVAYVLLPVRDRLVDHGISPRLASAGAASGAFLLALALIVPLSVALYSRRGMLTDFVSRLPPGSPSRSGAGRSSSRPREPSRRSPGSSGRSRSMPPRARPCSR